MNVKLGDLVSVDRWDHSETKSKRIGSPATVIGIEHTRGCESGIMVTVEGSNFKHVTLDSNWLEPYEKELL